MSSKQSVCYYVSIMHPVMRLVTPVEMCKKMKISKSKLYRDIKLGTFQKPLMKGNKILGWGEAY